MQYRTYSDRAFFFASCDQEGEGGGGHGVLPSITSNRLYYRHQSYTE